MKKIIQIVDNERGVVLIVAILILVILTLLGVTGIKTSSTEQAVAVNEEIYKMTFYAAEAGRTYVMANTDLYHTLNVTVGPPGLNFPDDANPANKDPIPNSDMSINGNVEYTGAFALPRGSGYEHPKFRSHRYKMTSNGYGPRNAQVTVEAAFYRVGF
ncbi:MAG TPA: hypothetical protein ENI07_12525 [Desulfobacterales bacterium]|nr:hypothetical protein [Desulfobacterales bacterium]